MSATEDWNNVLMEMVFGIIGLSGQLGAPIWADDKTGQTGNKTGAFGSFPSGDGPGAIVIFQKKNGEICLRLVYLKLELKRACKSFPHHCRAIVLLLLAVTVAFLASWDVV